MIYHNYIFLGIDPSLHLLSKTKRKMYEEEFLAILKKEKTVVCNSYAILGFKNDIHIFFWFQSDSIEHIQNVVNELFHTKLGKYLLIKHTLLGMTRPTQYSQHSKGHINTSRKGEKFLIIYPFTKTQSWYALPFEKRRALMGGHVGIGKKHSNKISQLLLYSYGIDDSEFIVSYETDDLEAFQTLVMELRSDPVREYTKNDTPIFMGIYKSHKDVLSYL